MYYRIANDTACKWCQSQQASSNQSRDINFARHTNCKCIIINTNEATSNYRNKKDKLNKKYLTIKGFQEELNKSLNSVVTTNKAINPIIGEIDNVLYDPEVKDLVIDNKETTIKKKKKININK